MKFKITLVVLLFGASGLLLSVVADEVPPLITVQGYLTNAEGNAVPNAEYSAIFSIYNVDAGGTQLWTETRTIGTVDGVFSIILGNNSPLPGDIFGSTTLFLGIAVAGDPELTPRQRLVTSPYAFRALNADTAAYALAGVGGSSIWTQDGNYVKLPTQGDSVGIGVAQPLYKLHVEGQAVSGVNSAASGDYSTISGGGNNTAGGERSVISGGQLNTASGSQSTIGGGYSNIAGGQEATIAGGQKNIAGGAQSSIGGGEFNTATGWRSTIGGGYIDTASGEYSTIGGGTYNVASGEKAAIGGGAYNRAEGFGDIVAGGGMNVANGGYSTVAGGGDNDATGYTATVAGGLMNLASGSGATVGGGTSNFARGSNAVVPGGNANYADGFCSFAAGQQAQATHDGSFVWCDGNNALTSSAINEFSVLASGGFRFFTHYDLNAGVTLASGSGSWASMSDRNAKENIEELDLDALLDKLAELPISSWNYKAQDESIRHIGPMAQDFYAAFGYGEDDKHITAIDAEGIALAAIKALCLRQQENDSQAAEIEKLNDDVARLEALIKQLLNERAKR